MAIGKTVEVLRKRRAWSQLTLARVSGVAQTYISELERGAKKNPGILTAKKLARALGVSLEELAR
jgi:transcriptional regulator with XRE-family HTH domain